MAFNEIDKLKALAIVHIFETSRPFGEYAAYAVLNDGAGVSYGINQFTHRSGSLFEVIRNYLASGGTRRQGSLRRQPRRAQVGVCECDPAGGRKHPA